MGQKNGKPTTDNPSSWTDRQDSIQVNRSVSSLIVRGKARHGRNKRSSVSTMMTPEIQTESPDGLTMIEKCIIRESFNTIKQTVGEVGVVFFMRLFETHPEVQGVFLPFKGLTQEDLKHSSQLLQHGLRVMGFVEKCVARMDQPEKLVTLCRDLGLRHQKYQVPHSYLIFIPPQFIYAIKPTLQDKWTDEMEEAWMKLFNFAIYYMRESMATEIAIIDASSRKGSKDNT